ncbi:MAG TPA: VWA domain-containing protein [Vicinamibacterales bacterium]|nr:VWA domain-containing protein [Vicinamibacterales bacterium]
MRLRVALFVLVIPAILAGSQEQELPRFRGGTNLVRVDAYVSKDDVAITDLKADDFLVFEDDKPQTIEAFELVTARAPNPPSERIDPTNVRDMRQDAADAARVFTLFFDRMFVSLSGSYHARKPIIETIDRLIGPDDLIGVMTPEMSPGSITYNRRTGSIERFVTDNWHWGERDRATRDIARTPQEKMLEECYGPYSMSRTSAGDIYAELIARLREQQTLDALESLVIHLEGLRPERKFVMVFTEGWPLFRQNDRLVRAIKGQVPTGDPLGTDPRTGGLRRPGSPDPMTGATASMEQCERMRTMLAYIDHEVDFRQLLQRANRANVSFYPIDARGLIVFDTPIEWGVPPSVDAAWLRKRHDDLRVMAEQTDGHAVLDTSNVAGAMQKIFADVGSYYLLSYYSTNQRLDGRFRRIRVEVKRDEVKVRARPGYLAPTEAEARAAGAAFTAAGAKNVPPPTVTRALDSLTPVRGNLPVRVQAAGAPGTIRAIVELDAATAKQPEWLSGGTLKVTFEPERSQGTISGAASQTVTLAIEPGQRSIPIDGTTEPLTAGRYAVRAELMPRSGRLPIQVTTFATVPAEAAQVGTGALASRRGPSTGLAYVPTADPRFRRTERLRVEVPVASDTFSGAGRLLTREGQPLQVVVNVTTRTDDKARHAVIGEAVLAPLAAGEYVLELSLTKDGKTEVVSYGFRLVP